MITASSIRYGLRSAAASLNPARQRCPSCGSRDRVPLERKWIVTQLVRCGACRLMYRVPTDSPQQSERFYQREYLEGYTSSCPTPEALAALVASGFAGTERDYTGRIAILLALGVAKGATVLDYGASWGYGVWQLRASGYQAVGYEISRPRAAYAREKLALHVFERLEDLPRGIDVFFSSHAIEHVPAPHQIFALARRLTRPGGLFVAFTPNGSAARRAKPEQAANVAHMWGQVHPIVLDDVFYRHALANQPTLLATNPYSLDLIRGWNQRTDLSGDLSGGELLAVTVLA
jgi:2-polyprenyl-3-methyl-5-hydroxy-6-metoxy-1,4-benzoquinol methylase